MTERKSFKKIVRARMDRTGESYTTAHRQVSARRAAALPAGLVPGYAEFGPVLHRPSDMVGRLLRQAGVDISAVEACGLGGGIGFMYAVFEYKAVPHPLLTIVAQHHPEPWAPAVLGRLGVPYTEQHSTATPAALTKLRRALDGGRPVQCAVNRSALPWHPDNPMVAADPYSVVVAGADGDTLYIDDQAAMPHKVDAATFGAAWAGHRKGRHRMIAVGDAPTTVDLSAAVRDAIATTVAHLTGPVLGNSFDVNFGFSGMAKFAAELRDPRGKTGWARRFGSPAGFAHAMTRLAECIEREYTAPGATRPLYADFLDKAARLLDAPAAGQAAGLFRESGRTWSRIAGRAAEMSDPGARPDDAALRALFDELAGLTEACLRAEGQAVDALKTLR